MLTLLATLIGTAETENAVANGDTRTLTLFNPHTQENISATFRRDGRYDTDALEKLNWFLRDWRHDEPTKMDPRLFDATWETYRESGSQTAIEVVSAYRSPGTNAMLRRRSRAVAENSQHMNGKAMDLHFPDVAVSRIRDIAMRMQRGGVGYYPTGHTPWVHIDVGSVRYWPRMSYDAMARIFPDGKTVYIPSNGRPMARYEEARAEIEGRGSQIDPSERPSKSLFAWLFGGPPKREEDESATITSARGAARSRLAAAAPAPVPASAPASPASNAPVAPVAPAPIQVASAAPDKPLPPRRPIEFAALAAQMPAFVPTPPVRPVALAALSPPAASRPVATDATTTPANVAALFAKAAATLPSVITNGPEGRAPTPALAYAALPPAVGGASTVAGDAVATVVPRVTVARIAPAAGAALRLPAPRATAIARTGVRSDFVPARLDRTNIAVLVGPADLSHMAEQGAWGSSVQPVRAAARLDVMAMAFSSNAILPMRLGAEATPLKTTRFNGGAAAPAALASAE